MGRAIRFLIPVFLATAIFGSQHYGYVRSGKKAIPGATVTATMDKYKLVTTTDETGLYLFEIPEKGKWQFQVEMFGFATAHEEMNLPEVSTVLDFNLELQIDSAPKAPETATTTAAGFQTVDVKEQADSQASIEQQVEASALPAAASPVGSSDINEAFLVNGSLSGGLLAVQQQNFFDQMDQDVKPAKKVKKSDTADLGPGGKRAKKAAKRARKKNAADTVTSFGATKQQNQIKGNVLYSLRDSGLDGSPYSLSGQPVNKPGYAQHRFGVAAGGALDIPHFIHSPQTFFFFNYTGVRGDVPYAGFDTVPTLVQRTGDFSQPTVSGPLVLYDPISHLPLAGNKVPASRFDPIARGLLSYIPTPNEPGGVMNYQYLAASAFHTDDFSVKLNHNLNDKNKFSLSFNLQRRNAVQPQLYQFLDQMDGLGWQSDIGFTHNFTPRTINSFHFAFSRNRNNYLPQFAYGPDVAAALGIQGTSPEPINNGPPNLSFTNFGNMTDGTPLIRRDQSAALRDGVTLVRGKHSMNIGGEYRRQQINPITDTYGRGAFTFTGLSTTGFDNNLRILPGTGFDFADFLFGFPNQAKVRYGTSSNYFRSSAYSTYFVDDWKVRSNLSLNLGLRWEYFTPYVEKYNRMANLDLATGVTGAAVVVPGGTGPYSGVFPRALIDSDPGNLSPRASIAWRPTEKRHVILRAGYSIFYNGSIYGELPSHLASQPPFAQSNSILASLDYALRMSNGFLGASSKIINNSFAIDRAYKDGYAQTWNFTIEQNLTKSLVLELGYLGTKGTRLDIQRSPNRAQPGSPLTAEDRRLIGDAVGFTYETSDGNSILHAGQLRLTRRLKKGMSLMALYTYSKSIDDVPTLGGGAAVLVQNDKDLRAERGLSSFDQRQALNLNFTAQSPIGKGLLSPDSTAAKIFRTWTLSGNLTAMSGLPFTARVLGNLSDSGGSGNFGSSRADATGLSVTGGSGFFNKAAFGPPPLGAFGDAGRNTIPGPDRFSLNLSLVRSFHATERHHIEVRLDGFNVTNSVIFTNFGTVLNALNYGSPTAALPMRTFKVTVRYKF